MKKRLTALLLCLVMVMSLIPMAVWAEGEGGAEVTPNLPNSVDAFVNVTGVVKVTCQTAAAHNASYDLLENDKEQSKTYWDVAVENGKFMLTIYKDEYFSKYAAEHNDPAHEAVYPANQSSFGTSKFEITPTTVNGTTKWLFPSDSNGNFFTTIDVKCTPEETPIPEGPSAEDFNKLYVTVKESSSSGPHGSKYYSLQKGDCEPRIVEGQTSHYYKDSNGAWNCTFQLSDNAIQNYITKYSNEDDIQTQHYKSTVTSFFGFTYSESQKVWVPYGMRMIEVNCVDAPTADQLDTLLGKVTVNCTTNSGHSSKSYRLDAVTGGYTLSTNPVVKTNAQGVSYYILTMTIHGSKYVEQFIQDNGNVQHLLTDSNKNTITLYLQRYLTNNLWRVVDSDSENAVTISQPAAIVLDTQCAPAAPTDAELLALGKVDVSCTEWVDQNDHDKGTRHGSTRYDLVANTFTRYDESYTPAEEAQVVPSADGSKWTYTFWLTERGKYEFKGKFDAANNSDHSQENLTKSAITLEYVNGKWQLAQDGAALLEVYKCNTYAKPSKGPTDEFIRANGKVEVRCDNYNIHSEEVLPMINDTYVIYDDEWYWHEDFEVWTYKVYLRNPAFDEGDGISPYVDQYSAKKGVRHLMRYADDSVVFSCNEKGEWKLLYPALIWTVCAPSATDLGLNVNVSCVGSGKHSSKTYDKDKLLADSSLDFKLVWNDTKNRYEYQVSLTKTAAEGYVANYSKLAAVNKTHTLKDYSSFTTIFWYQKEDGPSHLSLDANTPAVQANTTNKWMLTDANKHTLSITATCDTTTTPSGGGGGGFPKKNEPTIKSATTFDGGVALYAGLGILSMTGSAVVIRRKKEF